MNPRRMKIANLDEQSLQRVQALEEDYGSIILAVEPYFPLAKLSEEQVIQLQKLEQELGVVLIAFNS